MDTAEIADKYIKPDGTPATESAGANRLPIIIAAIKEEIEAGKENIRRAKDHEQKSKTHVRKSEEARKAALENDMRIGALLNEAKPFIGHGNWTGWLHGNFGYASDTKLRYCMRLASRREDIEAKTATGTAVADLGVKAAVASLAKPRTASEAPALKKVEYITLDAWKALTESERVAALSSGIQDKGFNRQENASIEWAQWSWNPVTGCLHNCPYCYARDIAESGRMAGIYPPERFTPTIWPERLRAPFHTVVPQNAADDMALRNVFVCSMADLFGRWVPAEWIEAVLREVCAAPQWNFLFLTKFPKRLAEFEFPSNAWIGTTVDCQARVTAAERAFENVTGGKKWLSLEPMIEPLAFSRLDLFDWMVLGGASRSTQTPEWRPPIEWWAPLYMQARAAGLEVFIKDNLFERERGFPGRERAPMRAPDVFHYLGKKTKDEVEVGEAAA